MFDTTQPGLIAGLCGALISIFVTKILYCIYVFYKRQQVVESMQDLGNRLRPVLKRMEKYDANIPWTKELEAAESIPVSWYNVFNLLKLNEIINSPTSGIYTTMKVAQLVAAEAAARAAVDGVKERVSVQRDGQWVLQRPPTSPRRSPAAAPRPRSPCTPAWFSRRPQFPGYRRLGAPHLRAPGPPFVPTPAAPLYILGHEPPRPYISGGARQHSPQSIMWPQYHNPLPPPEPEHSPQSIMWPQYHNPLPAYVPPPKKDYPQRRKEEKKEKNNIPFEKERRKEDEKKREKSRKGEKNRDKKDQENKKNEMEKGDSKDQEGKKIKEAAKTKEERKQKSSQENKKERCPEEEMPHHQHHREEEEARKEENEEKMAPYEKECKNLLSSSEDPLHTISSSHQEEIHPQGLPRLPRRRRRGGGIREYGHGNEADASAHPHFP